MSWTPSSAPVAHLDRLDAQIHGEDRLKYAGIFIAAALAILLALLGWRAARTAIPAALLASLALGALHITNEVAIVAVFTTLSALGASVACPRLPGRSRAPRADRLRPVRIFRRLRETARMGGGDPSRAGSEPALLGNRRSDRHPPVRPAADGRSDCAPAARLDRIHGVLAVRALRDDRQPAGANGGGAIGLGLALAVLGARLSRRGLPAFVGALTATGAIVLAIVQHGLASPGPNHLRSAFGSGISGFLDVAVNRVPLVYAPAVHDGR